MSGPAIDFVLFNEAGFNAYAAILKDGGTSTDTRYYVEVSSLNLSGQFSSEWVNLAKGRYVYVVDNTDHLDAVPPMNFADDAARYALKIDLADLGGG